MATTVKKEFSFLELDKALSKIEGFEMGGVLENNEFSEVSEWIPTGNYLFNAQLSGSLFGGVANNRSLGLAGDPGTGKTFLCLNIVREAQAMGYDIIYCDTEGAIDRNQVKKFGIDVGRVRYQPIKTISDFKVFVANFVDLMNKAKKGGANPKVLIVVDSLGMLTTEKSVSDALKGKTASDMGLRSKEMRDVFRNITLDLTGLKVPLICTNHTTMAGIGGYIQTKEAAGGDGPIFSMSNVVLLSKANLKEDDKKTGIVVTSTFKKARFTRPYPIKFHISFMNGMNPYVGLEEFVSWEACGIERGKLEVDKKTGEMKFTPVASSPNWAIAHLGKTVPSRRLFTAEVFTEEVLRKLDENVIKPYFLLPDLVSEADLEELFDGENSGETETEEVDGQE